MHYIRVEYGPSNYYKRTIEELGVALGMVGVLARLLALSSDVAIAQWSATPPHASVKATSIRETPRIVKMFILANSSSDIHQERLEEESNARVRNSLLQSILSSTPVRRITMFTVPKTLLKYTSKGVKVKYCRCVENERSCKSRQPVRPQHCVAKFVDVEARLQVNVGLI